MLTDREILLVKDTNPIGNITMVAYYWSLILSRIVLPSEVDNAIVRINNAKIETNN